jgi:hypothetical protein
MKITTLSLGIVVLLVGTAGARDLESLLVRNESLPRPPATESTMRMVITNKSGQSRVREIKAHSSTDAAGTDKQVLVFLSPADVRDTRFLTIDYESGGKTVWIFDSSKNLPGIDESYFTLRFLERGR